MNPVWWFLILAVIFHLIMRYTVYGKHTYAIGSNEEAARMSGINVKRRHKVSGLHDCLHSGCLCRDRAERQRRRRPRQEWVSSMNFSPSRWR